MVCPHEPHSRLLLTYERMSSVCETWSLDDFINMDDEDMERLLAFYESGTVPSFDQISPGTEGESVFGFDGSFGWW